MVEEMRKSCLVTKNDPVKVTDTEDIYSGKFWDQKEKNYNRGQRAYNSIE